MKDKLRIPLIVIFLGFVAWWASFQHVLDNQGLAVQWFGATYGLLALVGSVIGFAAALKWGGFRTVLGKALTLFSLGLLAQEAGQLIYAYYIYGAKIDVPYPSWGDAAYFGSVLLYIAAAFFLSRATGMKFSLKDTKYKIIAVMVPAILLIISFWVFLYHHEYDTSNLLTVFLDFGYPMGQAVYISIAITAYLLSRKLLGGLMKEGILLVILALFIQYVADFTFVYQTSRETWVSGSYNDLMYLSSYFVMSMGLLKFLSIYGNLKKNFQRTEPTAPAVETKIETIETQAPVDESIGGGNQNNESN